MPGREAVRVTRRHILGLRASRDRLDAGCRRALQRRPIAAAGASKSRQCSEWPVRFVDSQAIMRLRGIEQ